MKRRVLYCCVTFVVLSFSMFSGRPLSAHVLLPQNILTTTEIKKLVNGQTAEAAFVKKGKGKGLLYFNPNGEFKRLVDNWLEEGRWRVNKRNRLCTSIAGQRWNCRMLARNEEGRISQFVAKKDSNHRLELTYEKFTDGSTLFERTLASISPLKKLNKQTITLLFSDKTVDSKTVRKGRESVTYYNPDGTLELMRNGKKHNGTWRVTDKGRMCLKLENSQEKCRIIVRQGESISKYIVKKNGHHQQSVYYRRFTPGKHF